MTLLTGILFLVVFVALFLLLYVGSERGLKAYVLTDNERGLLQQYVGFYNALSSDEKRAFEKRLQQFLSKVRITGVGMQAEDADRVLIAAGAIIPVFAFTNWQYTNLREVLLYPAAFPNQLSPTGPDGELYGGMVGWGDMQNSMMLSQQDLRAGFMYSHTGRNTAIHEFVHLIDKADGATDGVPEILLDNRHLDTWRQIMQIEMQKILSGASIIHPYGATNEAEFFAVSSEYFFGQPQSLRAAHPELFQMLSIIFKTTPEMVDI